MAACDQYAGAGFSVVAQDVLLGPFLRFTVAGTVEAILDRHDETLVPSIDAAC